MNIVQALLRDRRYRIAVLAASLLGAAASISAANERSFERKKRPANWAVAPAQPIPGLPNFYRVSDKLYRGAQLSAEGARRLQGMGIKTIVSLRAFHDDEALALDVPIARESIRFKTWHPENEDVIRFLKIVVDPDRTPVFVHCQHGADRTGTLIAIYRIVVEGWSKDEAIREMTEGGYGFHPLWKNLKRYIRELDVDAIRRQAGLTHEPTTPGTDSSLPTSLKR